jgi:hypothetical protein
VAYAVIVTLASWAVGAAVAFPVLFGGDVHDWAADTFMNVWQPVFLVTTVAALAVARRVSAPLPRWRTMVVDWGLYAAILLAVAIASSAAGGDEDPVGGGFVQLIFAFFTLQLPAALGLVAWRSHQLMVVLRQDPEPGVRFRSGSDAPNSTS